MNNNNNLQVKQVKLSIWAYNKVKEVTDESGQVPKEYKSYAKKIPMMIKTNGLGPTLAFVLSKIGNNQHGAYCLINEHIHGWLKEKFGFNNPYPENHYGLLKWIIDQNSEVYRHMTLEILELFSWLKRFSEGLIND